MQLVASNRSLNIKEISQTGIKKYVNNKIVKSFKRQSSFDIDIVACDQASWYAVQWISKNAPAISASED